jgi:hypothetical protein
MRRRMQRGVGWIREMKPRQRNEAWKGTFAIWRKVDVAGDAEWSNYLESRAEGEVEMYRQV